MDDNKLTFKPETPLISPIEMAKMYIPAKEKEGKEEQKETIKQLSLDMMKEMCVYTAVELWCQPTVRR